MDKQKTEAEVKRSSEHGKDSNTLRFGYWELEVNQPFGFVLRNTEGACEYHFSALSNGWFTGRDLSRSGMERLRCMNVRGEVVGSPILFDEKTLSKKRRVEVLLKKLKEKEITEEEKDELLSLQNNLGG